MKILLLRLLGCCTELLCGHHMDSDINETVGDYISECHTHTATICQ